MKSFPRSRKADRFRRAVTVFAAIAALTLLIAACYLPIGAQDFGNDSGGQNVTHDPADDPDPIEEPTDPEDGSGSGDPDDPYVVKSADTLIDLLQAGDVDLTAHYVLADDLDLTGFDWTPIGKGTTGFSGSFDGGGYTISGLDLATAGSDQWGLFGTIAADGVVRNVGIEGIVLTDDNTSKRYKGGIAGVNEGTIENCFVTGEISGSYAIGGLVGENNGGIIRNSYARVLVRATDGVGGLVGINKGGGKIITSYAAGLVDSGSTTSGGVLGEQWTDNTENEVDRAYFDKEVSTEANGAGGSQTNVVTYALTTAEAKDLASYPELDTAVWTIDPNLNDGYPILISNPPTQ